MSTTSTVIVHYDPSDNGVFDPATLVPCSTGDFASLRLGGFATVIIKSSEDAYTLLNHVEKAAQMLRQEGL